MLAKLQIEIDGKQYRLCATETPEESSCDKCVFDDAEKCPSDICTIMFPRNDTYFEKV